MTDEVKTKSPPTWVEIVALCDANEGPDRAIDGWIWALIKGGDPYIVGHKEGRFPRDPIYGTRLDIMREMAGKDAADYIGAPNFTSSLDAAVTIWPGEVPHLVPSDPRRCSSMAARARIGVHYD